MAKRDPIEDLSAAITRLAQVLEDGPGMQGWGPREGRAWNALAAAHVAVRVAQAQQGADHVARPH